MDAVREGRPSEQLSQEESEAVSARQGGSSRVVHEVVRLKGDAELERPATSLLLSGFCAGIAMSVSVLAEAALHSRLPVSPSRELIVDLGYTIGFLIVIMGRLQLFTESTMTAVLPLVTHPTGRNFARLAKLWSIVFAANLLGTLLVAWLVSRSLIVSPEQLAAAREISAMLLRHDAWRTFLLGIPAGFLIAALAWILPSAKGSEVWVIFVITYAVSICGFSHVIAGSMEAWLVWLSGDAGFGWSVFGFIGPALLGNIVGGTGLFAVLAHGQVRSEI
jgi:formate/nitrite transporter FocA (FNT family)